ncbi:MAG: TerB family tellurite resistance protein [Methylomonas sp.]|jgi:uncharacterized tellurite resistance protein B-like protein|uniref:tellurite resistance TerB family protein n=1 Tax=Methylomonas sp. TaxID=418 RepID=UPI0025EC801A|nr:TerB family tellurite resistance protein [Methylomonas sp.]MCK9608694.1 TerB family tellurite resistance protein [Methylomonas sp.]
MLNQIKLFFEQHLSLPSPENSTTEEQLKLASVALFMEMLQMDDIEDQKERALILALVKKDFVLTTEQAESLIALAEQQREQATDYYEFTSLINKQCSLPQKIQFIEALWRIAYIDGVLDVQEEYLVRKIAGLLHVPHIDFIMARNRVNPS